MCGPCIDESSEIRIIFVWPKTLKLETLNSIIWKLDLQNRWKRLFKNHTIDLFLTLHIIGITKAFLFFHRIFLQSIKVIYVLSEVILYVLMVTISLIIIVFKLIRCLLVFTILNKISLDFYFKWSCHYKQLQKKNSCYESLSWTKI